MVGAAGASAGTKEAWLADIYHFRSLGPSEEERPLGTANLPTPFIPAAPRVDEDRIFNFDHAHPVPHQPPLCNPPAVADIDSHHHADLHHFDTDPDAYHADADADTYYFDANAPTPSTSASHTEEERKRWEVEVRAKWEAEE